MQRHWSLSRVFRILTICYLRIAVSVILFAMNALDVNFFSVFHRSKSLSKINSRLQRSLRQCRKQSSSTTLCQHPLAHSPPRRPLRTSCRPTRYWTNNTHPYTSTQAERYDKSERKKKSRTCRGNQRRMRQTRENHQSSSSCSCYSKLVSTSSVAGRLHHLEAFLGRSNAS